MHVATQMGGCKIVSSDFSQSLEDHRAMIQIEIWHVTPQTADGVEVLSRPRHRLFRV